MDRAVQAFEVLNSSEEGADEIAYSQMMHCYGSAGCEAVSSVSPLVSYLKSTWILMSVGSLTSLTCEC